MRTVVVLAADLEEHRPRGRARDRVHEPLAHALDLGDDAVVAQRAVGLRVVGAPDDGEASVPAWGEQGRVASVCAREGPNQRYPGRGGGGGGGD